MILLSGGQPRTGSTVTFQSACKLVEYAEIGKSAGPIWTNESYSCKNFEHLALDSQWHVAKSHLWRDEFEGFQDRIIVLKPVRDLRDVAISLNHFFPNREKGSFMNWYLDQHYEWFKHSLRIITFRYEDYIYDENLRRLPYFIAHFLDIDLCDVIAKRIYNECCYDTNLQDINTMQEKRNKYGLYARRHIYNGQPGYWQEELTEYELDRIHERGAKFMCEYNYFDNKGLCGNISYGE